MGIPALTAITLSGGSTFSGITFIYTTQNLRNYGLQFSINNDKSRQTLLSFLLLLVSLCGLFVYPLTQSECPPIILTIMVFTMFTLVQFSLVIVNHNSLIKLSLYYHNRSKSELSLVEKYPKLVRCLYLIPFFTLIPIYFALMDTVPKNIPLPKSYYNTAIFKPLNICLVLITESLALWTDILLLVKVGDVGHDKVKELLNQSDKSVKKSSKPLWINKVHQYSTKDIWWDYALIWGSMMIDIFIKVLISTGTMVLFDTAITACSLAIRSQSALNYGLRLRELLDAPPIIGSNQTMNNDQMKELQSLKLDILDKQYPYELESPETSFEDDLIK
ncbi:hypothetical protein BC833DRAFT_590563 [Globomyces pollinis-pini]|nr:hypothetical protein BC833DRAFT_590563 [Globomyces pollinis-pini]